MHNNYVGAVGKRGKDMHTTGNRNHRVEEKNYAEKRNNACLSTHDLRLKHIGEHQGGTPVRFEIFRTMH